MSESSYENRISLLEKTLNKILKADWLQGDLNQLSPLIDQVESSIKKCEAHQIQISKQFEEGLKQNGQMENWLHDTQLVKQRLQSLEQQKMIIERAIEDNALLQNIQREFQFKLKDLDQEKKRIQHGESVLENLGKIMTEASANYSELKKQIEWLQSTPQIKSEIISLEESISAKFKLLDNRFLEINLINEELKNAADSLPKVSKNIEKIESTLLKQEKQLAQLEATDLRLAEMESKILQRAQKIESLLNNLEDKEEQINLKISSFDEDIKRLNHLNIEFSENLQKQEKQIKDWDSLKKLFQNFESKVNSVNQITEELTHKESYLKLSLAQLNQDLTKLGSLEEKRSLYKEIESKIKDLDAEISKVKINFEELYPLQEKVLENKREWSKEFELLVNDKEKLTEIKTIQRDILSQEKLVKNISDKIENFGTLVSKMEILSEQVKNIN